MKKENYFNLSVSDVIDGVATIDIYGVIGDSESDGNDKGSIKKELDKLRDLEASKIIVNVSSFGGVVDDALVIYDLLRGHEAEIETNISGYTASSGTIVAMAGDTVTMSENALFLIHRAWTLEIGNAITFLKKAEQMEKTDDRIATIYAAKGGKDKAFYLGWMDKEEGNGVWLDADEVKDELGLIDNVTRNEYKKAAYVSNDVIAEMGLPELPKNKIKQPKNETVADSQEIDTGAESPINDSNEQRVIALKQIYKQLINQEN